ncbi:MAG: MFS transporter, partial [Bacteroidales bacterium]|nr:MFS transporter [Bacteroidales bacterium]
QVAIGSHAMAHYAFASGIMNLGFMLPGMISGWLYQQVGFQWFFAIALLLAVPVFVLAKKVPFVAVGSGNE